MCGCDEALGYMYLAIGCVISGLSLLGFSIDRWLILLQNTGTPPKFGEVVGFSLLAGVSWPLTTFLGTLCGIAWLFSEVDCKASQKSIQLRQKNERIKAGAKPGMLSAPETETGALAKCDT